MWNLKRLNAVSLNSLQYKCIAKSSEVNKLSTSSCLPLDVRQEIIDYLTRERVPVNAEFVRKLLNGGVYALDLWSLTEVNNYGDNDVAAILDTLADNTCNLKELSLGGEWIYNKRVVDSSLRRLFTQTMNKLSTLRLQQTDSIEQFVSILEWCPNLKHLEICHPSLSDRDLFADIDENAFENVRKNLKELHIPSTLKRDGIIRMLSLFPNVQWFKCARFEWVMDAMDAFEARKDGECMQDVANCLSKLRGLTVTHPMSNNSIDRIVRLCPSLEELSLEVQEGMRLESIAKMSNLKKLHLHNSPNLATSFIEQVLPVLRAIGSNLDSLEVEQFDVVDLKDLAFLCPNLKSLSAQWFTIVGCNHFSRQFLTKSEREAIKNRFSNLRHIRLRPRIPQSTVHSECVKFIIGRALLIEDIELYCCHNLNDNDMDQIHATNCLQHLKSFILRHGHSVSRSAIDQLTKECTQLQYIDCGQPTLSKAELVPIDNENELPFII